MVAPAGATVTLERPLDAYAKLLGKMQLDARRLYPPLWAKLGLVVEELEAQNIHYVPYSGFRTFSEQAQRYFSGRTRPGPVLTNAMAGYSGHNYGIAVDCYREVDGGASWRGEDYDALGEAAERHGLAWAGRWKTFPEKDHVYWPGYATADELRPLRQLAQAHLTNPLLGATDWLTAVWDYVSAHNPKEPNA